MCHVKKMKHHKKKETSPAYFCVWEEERMLAKKRLQIWYLEHGNWIVILARLFYLVLPLHVAISLRIKTEEYFQVQVCKSL